MGSEADTVISEAVLGEVIGANFFVSFAGADLLTACGLHFSPLLFSFFFQKTGGQNAHGGSTVFDLGAAVLAAHNQAGGNMEDLNRGIGGVDALSARTSGATNFNADFIGSDLKLHFLRNGKNGDRCSGGVDSPLGLGGGYALDAMDSAFVAHGGKHGLARQFEDNFLEAAELGRAGGEGIEFPSPGFGVTAVHPKKIPSKDGSFGSACTRSDFYDGVAVFIRIRWKNRTKDFGFCDGFVPSEFGGLLLCHLSHFRIQSGGAEGGVFLEAGGQGNEAASGLGTRANTGMFPGKVASAGPLAVEIWISHFTIEFVKAGFESGELGGGIHNGGGGTMPTPEGVGTGSPRVRLRALFRFRGGGRGVEATAEFFNPASGVDQLLGAGEERVAGGADTQADLGFCGASVVGGSTGTRHNTGFKFGMNFRLHRSRN